MRRFWLSFPAALLACSQPAHPAGPPSPPVVRFGGQVITAHEFQDEMSEQTPFVRSRYQTVEKKKEFLDNMIRLDLLAEEARKAGFDQDDEVQRDLKKSMVSHFMRSKFNDHDGMASIPDSDLQAYYDAHKDDYQRPERMRIQLLLFKGDPQDGKLKAEADKAAKDLAGKLQKNDTGAFANLARMRSDDAVSKVKGGDIDFHTKEELEKLYGPEVASAADQLKGANEMSPVVSTKDGLYLIRMEARQQAFNRTFDQVKSTLQARLWNERRNQKFEDYVKDLRTKANIQWDDTELSKVDVTRPDLSANQGSAPPPPAGLRPPLPAAPGAPSKP